MGSVYLLDCETTGKKMPMEPIEVAWLKVIPDPDADPALIGRQWKFDSWHQRYKPSIPMTCGAVAVHHILPTELEGCPPSSSFSLPADCEYLIGHSIDFDWEAIGKPDVKRICTLAMSRHVWPDATGHSQSALIYFLRGMTPKTREILQGAHGAQVDVSLNAFLLMHILNAVKEPIATWADLHAFSEECRIPRVCPMRRWEGILLADMETSAIEWCLRLPDLDHYYRLGLERVMAARYPAQADGQDEDGECGTDDWPF